MPGDTEYVICVLDPFDYTVLCSKGSWERYIVAGHDELEGHLEDVRNTISNPDSIYPSCTNGSAYVACKSGLPGFQKPVLKVVVYKDDVNRTGKVKTAYTAMKEEGENIAPTRIYPADNV
jgi:hypothetical protein